MPATTNLVRSIMGLGRRLLPDPRLPFMAMEHAEVDNRYGRTYPAVFDAL